MNRNPIDFILQTILWSVNKIKIDFPNRLDIPCMFMLSIHVSIVDTNTGLGDYQIHGIYIFPFSFPLFTYDSLFIF